MTTYQKAREFIYRNARPLDLARWQYHFENGSKEAVLTALTAYQNKDGGFGHALEPDAWNPYSSPIQTWQATEILREIDFTDNTHPIIQGILRYLASGRDFNGRFWYNTIPTNNDYPHAPWWHTESVSFCHHEYNPTACLAGFILHFAKKDSELYALGCRIAGEAATALLDSNQAFDMAVIGCYIRLMEYCMRSDSKLFDMEAIKNRLAVLVKGCITPNTDIWETSYVCKPSNFISSKDSFFYMENKDLADYECDFILKTQLADGSWNIPWCWNAFPEEWAVSKNWWKSNGIILNLLYLKGMGRLA